jgi:uncharacterized membrane protein
MKKEVNALSKHRIEGLTDSIYAFAMTLLVLSFDIPTTIKGFSGLDINQILLGQSDKFLNYFVSFALLAIFWLINQQQFHHIDETDNNHIWLNVITLMFIVFIPFSTSVVGEFPDQTMTEFFFAANLFIVGASMELGWFYATQQKCLLSDGCNKEHLMSSLRSGMLIPVVTVISMMMAFVYPSAFIYMTIPAFLFIPGLNKLVK